MTHKRHSLNAVTRKVTGKKVGALRREGWLPASVYGKSFESVSVQVNQKELDKLFKEVGESQLVDIVMDSGEAWPVLFKNPQYHPVFGTIMHLDMHKVNLKEKITAEVPIELVGESDAVKAGNVLIEVTMEVEVEALPTDLPEKIVVDISKLDVVNAAITVADLQVDRSKVEIKNIADQVIVKVAAPKEEVIEEVATVAPGEVPATEQKTPEELAAEEKVKEGEKKKES